LITLAEIASLRRSIRELEQQCRKRAESVAGAVVEEEAMDRYGRPEIFNTDQGGQFTSTEFTGLLTLNGIRISMDGKGCWRDNVFVERLWRTIKYEQVYLHAYSSMDDAKTHLKEYLEFYNTIRPHRSLDGRTPDAVYYEGAGAEKHAA
jgi:putative transposase